MRLVYWNIRAGGGKRKDGIIAQLKQWQPDVIGLSEFRGTPASQFIAEALSEMGWSHQISTTNPKKLPLNALLLASKTPLKKRRFAAAPDERERWLLAKTSHNDSEITIGLTHVLNYTSKRKYPMLSAIVAMMKSWRGGPAIIGGDTNSGKFGIDEENLSPSFFKREHQFLVDIESLGWVDAFRHLHGDTREFTWYSHKNNGFRLDQAFLNPALRPKLKAVRHEWGFDPTQPERRDALSDHAALIIDIL